MEHDIHGGKSSKMGLSKTPGRKKDVPLIPYQNAALSKTKCTDDICEPSGQAENNTAGPVCCLTLPSGGEDYWESAA